MIEEDKEEPKQRVLALVEIVLSESGSGEFIFKHNKRLAEVKPISKLLLFNRYGSIDDPFNEISQDLSGYLGDTKIPKDAERIGVEIGSPCTEYHTGRGNETYFPVRFYEIIKGEFE